MMYSRYADLFIDNTPVSLSGTSVGCTAEVSPGSLLPCTPNITLEVQGNLIYY